MMMGLPDKELEIVPSKVVAAFVKREFPAGDVEQVAPELSVIADTFNQSLFVKGAIMGC
jgi:hypothetical protein